MNQRRKFIKNSLIGSVTLLTVPSCQRLKIQSRDSLDYEITRDVPTQYFDGEMCYVHPRAGLVPNQGVNGMPEIAMTMTTLDLAGSDVFKGMYGLYTSDMGKTWSSVEKQEKMSPRFETIDGVRRPVAASDFTPQYHKSSKKLLGIGHTVAYTTDWKVAHPRPRHTSYSTYNPTSHQWKEWRKLEMPDLEKFYNAGAGSVQRYDLENGEILLPIYFLPPDSNSQVTVLRCVFDGETLRYKEHGNELSIDDDTRGLHEPSLTYYKGKYFLVMRNDKTSFVTSSQDGLNYLPYKKWTFDDGSDLGTYNTQQHWVTHSNGLFLVYTRRGADNDHVFRHRAPLFIAQVDPDKLQVIRDTERILVEERGARLGNFGVVDISPDETWVTVSEWMQPSGVEKYGSDGSVWVARLHWGSVNELFGG